MKMDLKSDADRLLECFERGVSQRSQVQRSGDGKGKTPRKYAASYCSEAASSDDNLRTPQGKENMIGRAGFTRGVGLMAEGSAGKLISPGVFYGSPLGKPATKSRKFLSLLNDIRKDLGREKQSREVGPVAEFTQTSARRAAIWATFPRQEQAIQFADSDSKEKLVVFQYQDHVNGQRRFLATTYEEFWHRYNGMIPHYRHHYEIIQDGKPCHLYFDLEFNRRANTEADGEAMVDLLLLVVQRVFLDVYDLQYCSSWTIELDSSTIEKFSRHLIIRIPGAAFKSNSHVGSFVGEISRRIHQLRESCEDLHRLFVLQGESLATYHTELFVDQAVYSRNRSFRLPFSSKAGKTAKLVPTERFRCKNMGEKPVFMDSLICRLDDKCDRLLTFGEENPGRGGTLDFARWKENPTAPPKRLNFCVSGKSPFPALDTFVESVVCIGNVQGRIRSWYWFAEYGVVLYNISENRYCENIGRPHKSNGVMYIVDFRTAGYYQKCHDVDCRGFRSILRPIPRHTIPPEYPLSSANCRASQEYLSQERDQTRLFGEEWGDESWWEEVVSSLASLECESQSRKSSQTHPLADETFEDDWWCAVEHELQELERFAVLSSSQQIPPPPSSE